MDLSGRGGGRRGKTDSVLPPGCVTSRLATYLSRPSSTIQSNLRLGQKNYIYICLPPKYL